MSATRLLILGVLRIRPLHGYEVRRELETWRAETWANIAYGSIYFALNKLTEERLIEPADPNQEAGGKRAARTTYRVTEAGEQEYQRLLREAWWQVKPVIDPFQVALAFMDDLPREELLMVLRYRLAGLEQTLMVLDYIAETYKSGPDRPRHVRESFRLSAAELKAKREWMAGVIAKLERGELP